MKKNFLLAITCISAGVLSAQNVGINTDGSNPSSMLHVKTTSAAGSDGILIENPNGGNGDAIITFRNNGSADEWTLGFDDSDNDDFKISQSAALGTSNALTIDGSTIQILAGSNGTNSDPVWSFENDDNTGAYRAAADNYSIAAAGTETVRSNTTSTSFMQEVITRETNANSGDILVRLYDSSDDGIVDVYQNNAVDIHLHASDNSYYNPNGANNRVFMIGHSTPFYPALDLFEANGGATGYYAVNGYTQGSGVAIYGESSSTGLAELMVGIDLVSYIARASNNNTNGEGGLLVDGTANGANWSSLAMRWGGTWYKVGGSGTVSTVVPDENGVDRFMYCPEAPEVLFQDYGTGQLVNGEVYITLDPIFAKNIYIDEDRPLKVIITIEGECNGVYVTNKSKDGFLVKELGGGASNVSFSYMVVGNRVDVIDEETGEMVSKYQDIRFPLAPTVEERRKNVPKNKILDKMK